MDTTRVVLAYLSHEAGFKEWLKGVVSKIPGLPSKEQALKVVMPLVQKNPEVFDRAVDEILRKLESIPTAGIERTAFDMRGLMQGIRTVTDPKMVFAIIALMAMFQTADAGALRDRIRGNTQQEQQVDQAPDWVKSFEKSAQGNSGSIQVDGKDYAVGKYKQPKNERDPGLAKDMADNLARQAGGKDLIKRYFGNDAQGNTAMFSLFSK